MMRFALISVFLLPKITENVGVKSLRASPGDKDTSRTQALWIFRFPLERRGDRRSMGVLHTVVELFEL